MNRGQRFVLMVMALMIGVTFNPWVYGQMQAQEKPAFSPDAFGDLEERVHSLEEYAQRLSDGLEYQIRFMGNKTIRLSIISKNYQAIATNSGTFLVAVDDLQHTVNGYTMQVRIGNISAADFGGFKIVLRMGNLWDPKSSLTYEDWRNSLKEFEFNFQGKLSASTWTPVEIILGSIPKELLAYIEMEMTVNSVELRGP